MQMYCVKCRAKTEATNVAPTTLKNGKPAMKGTCSVCGKGVFRIGKAE